MRMASVKRASWAAFERERVGGGRDFADRPAERKCRKHSKQRRFWSFLP